MKLSRETVSTLQAGDFLLDERNGEKYAVRHILDYIAWNRPCYRLTLTDKHGRTIYADLASNWYGFTILKKPEAFYTGGGIWLAAMYTDDVHYYAIDNNNVWSLWYYDHTSEDQDTEYPTQGLIWEKEVSECTKEEQQIYETLRRTMLDEMKACGCDRSEYIDIEGAVLLNEWGFWDMEQDAEVSAYDLLKGWENLVSAEEYDGDFRHYVYDECLGKNGSLITMAEHEADLRKLAEDEARAEADFSPI